MGIIIIGLVIAYILNPIVGFFEKKVFKKVKSATKRRNFSIAVTFVTAFVILVAIFSVIIPQVLQSVISLINNSDSYVTAITDFIKKIISDGGDVEKYNDVNYWHIYWSIIRFYTIHRNIYSSSKICWRISF